MFKEEIRKKILERDKNRCQVDKHLRVSETSGVPCSKRLEVHHMTYKRAKGDKERMEDGITVCLRCHDFLTNFIRDQRYGSQTITVENIRQSPPKFILKEVVNETTKLQNYRPNASCNAQWRIGKSMESDRKADEKDKLKEEKNGS